MRTRSNSGSLGQYESAQLKRYFDRFSRFAQRTCVPCTQTTAAAGCITGYATGRKTGGIVFKHHFWVTCMRSSVLFTVHELN